MARRSCVFPIGLLAAVSAGAWMPATSIRAGELLISEFAALNSGTFVDEDGDSSDWLEVHNASGSAVNLSGWHLTDDSRLLRKWRFPAVTLEGGGHLLVFASGKDRSPPDGELHANFRLSGAGEFLALVRPDGATVEHAYAPWFPEQRSGFSYGIGRQLTVRYLLEGGAPARVLIPADDSAGTRWTGGDEPFEDSAWISGATGVGYLIAQPGFSVRVFLASTTVGSLSAAEEVTRNPGLQIQVHAENAGVLNYYNTGGSGHYPADSPFPGTTIGDDVNDFVVEATATLLIPAAGAWTFGVSSDDGFGLDIQGNGQSFRIEYPSPRGPGDTLGVFDCNQPGAYDLRLVFYEQGGGSELELYAARGSHASWSAAMRLVGDPLADGLLAESPPVGSGPGGRLRNLIGTDVEEIMHPLRTSAYVRVPFHVDDPFDYASLTLRVRYDDGFVAYLNGVEVARRNAPAFPTFDSRATADRPSSQIGAYQDIDISAHLGIVDAGPNVLALHGLNDRPDSGDFLVHAELAEITVESEAQGFFDEPTPGEPNGALFVGFVADTKFDPDRGFYDEPFSVTVSTATPGAQVYFTTDGSAPGREDGEPYAGPIPVHRTTTLRARAFKDGYLPTDIDTHTYIFLDDVLVQTGEGFPSSWVDAVADYEVDPDVVNDPLYRGTLRDDLKSLPSVSLVMDVEDLFGAGRGIYTHATSSGVAWERPGSVELIFPEGLETYRFDEDGFQVTCGVRMHGGVGRIPAVPKHSFRFLFKGDYGPTKLRYALFGDSATDSFDTLILRAGFNNSWVFNSSGEMQRAQYLRDEWMRDAHLDTGGASPHGIFVHLYLNGLYWGLYNFVERPSAPFAASYFGGDKEEWDILNSSEVIDGSKDAWNQAQALARAGLATEGAYATIREYLDVPNLIDYMLVNFYGGNSDWDGHNWYSGRRRVPGAGYKFFSWDAERTLEPVTGADRTGIGQDDMPSGFYRDLRANEEFLMLFADHAHRHLHNGGALSPEVAGERYRLLAEAVHGGIAGESARWGDSHRSVPFTRDVEWAAERDRLLDDYFPRRTGVVVSQLRSAGLYPTIDAPRFSEHGGRIDPGFPLVMTASEGTVYYTIDGSDPRLPGGAMAPGAAIAGSSSTTDLVSSDASVRVLVPSDGSLGLAWTDSAFDDSGWVPGSQGVGFETGSGYEHLISTDVEAAMYGANASVYIRLEFELSAPSAVALIELRMMYDDGFVAYLNGERVGARNAPADPQWNSTAIANHGDAEATVFESIEIEGGAWLLRQGKNVLAIHGVNLSTTSSDLLLVAELRAVETSGSGVPLEGTTAVRARAWSDGEWSALTEALFHVDVPLRITEVMYHPRPPETEGPFSSRDFEYVEIVNLGDEHLDLGGLRLAGGIEYELPRSIVSFPPGGVLVVARNLGAFQERYPACPGIVVGSFSGSLGNSSDEIRLEGASGEPILDFEYEDDWYVETDGEGYSIVIVDPMAEPELWSEPESWRPSLQVDGSPGIVEWDLTPAGGRQLPGNINQDLQVDIADAVGLLVFLFIAGDRALPCGGTSISEGGNLLLADVNGDGRADVSDAVHLLDYLFRNGSPPARGTRCVRTSGCPDVCP